MTIVPGAAPSRVFYGWWVALALSTIVFLASGIRFTIGLFLKPVAGDLGLDRGSFSLVIVLSLPLYRGFTPLVGRLVDRVVCSAGAVVMAVSLFDLTGGYGAAFSVAGALLLIAAVRPTCRAVPMRSRPRAVAGRR